MADLVLYDISSPKQPRSYAPNPSKARLALGFKGLPFSTEWVDIIDIEKVRRGLACPATRKLDDGSDYFTLPMLQDKQTGLVLGDSFDIAVHLDSLAPPTPSSADLRLLPARETLKGAWTAYESPAKDTVFFAPITTNDGRSGDLAVYARFNLHVDATFSAHMAAFGQFLPLNPETGDAVKALMCRRAHLSSWDDICVWDAAARAALLARFEEDLRGLAALFGGEGEGEGEGVFLEGETPCYADLIVGGWLNMLSCIAPEAEWAQVRGWYGGVFGRLHDVLQERFFVC